MEDKRSSYVTLKEPHTIAGENQVHHEIKNNDVSKAWPPTRHKLQRSASIRYVYMLVYVLRCIRVRPPRPKKMKKLSQL